MAELGVHPSASDLAAYIRHLTCNRVGVGRRKNEIFLKQGKKNTFPEVTNYGDCKLL